jgi:vacuolar protein 8
LAVSDAENKRSIVTAGAIPSLVQLLREGTNGAKEKAAGALCCLAADDTENKRSVAAAGAIRPLVQLFREGTGSAKEMAAGALWNLVYYYGYGKAEFRSESPRDAWQSLLLSGSEDARGHADSLLKELNAWF